jgi:O-succinylbenzoic acid--CoA ligase
VDTRQLTLLPAPPGPGAALLAARAVSAALGDGPAVAILAADPRTAPLLATADRTQWSDTALVLATSGSTGDPLLVEIGAAAVRSAADITAAAVGGPGLWLTALPVTGIGGLMTVVRSSAAGVGPVVWPGIGGAAAFSPESFGAAVREAREVADAAGLPCFTSLVPTQVLRLVRAAAWECLAAFDHVLIGGDALSPGLAVRLQDHGVRFSTTYGATETCGGIVHDGVPLPGVTVRLHGAQAGTDDPAVELGGPTLARGYRGHPRLTGQRFRAGWFRTGDRGRWESGRLEVTGRCDDVIKVGAQKVSLSAVAAVLRSHPAVLDALVVAEPDAEWGTLPLAFVVPAETGGDASGGEEHLAGALAGLVAGELGRRAVPRAIRLSATLPEAASGKADRRAGGAG